MRAQEERGTGRGAVIKGGQEEEAVRESVHGKGRSRVGAGRGAVCKGWEGRGAVMKG
jgi:hypothetical protein